MIRGVAFNFQELTSSQLAQKIEKQQIKIKKGKLKKHI